MHTLDADLRDAYLRRLGLEREPPSADALARLHRRHVERVPYETLWIHGGERWDVDATLAARRIATQHRGGYCYHLNGAFFLLLRSLGYDVARRTGGVHGPSGLQPDEPGNHLVLTVTGLRSDANPDGVWYVDVGLGDALHEPLPLQPGATRQGPFLLTLTEQGDHEDESHGWHLEHDPAGGFRGMRWYNGAPDDELFVERHHWLSTSPDSGFVKNGLAQTRDANGVDVMFGLVGKRVGEGSRTDAPLLDRREWFDALADRFSITFEASDDDTTDRLWNSVVAAHRAWEALVSPGGHGFSYVHT